MTSAEQVETLAPFINEKRQARIEEVLAKRLHSIQLAIEHPSDINNALAAVRTAEALGVSKVHIICPEGYAGSARIITQGAFYWIDLAFYESLEQFLVYVKSQQLKLAGGALAEPERQIELQQVPVDYPVCLLLGNEQRGLSQQAKQACDYIYKIPMVGMSESLNLSVSAAISLFDTSNRKRERLAGASDLTREQAMQLRAKYFKQSVSKRLVEQLFKESE